MTEEEPAHPIAMTRVSGTNLKAPLAPNETAFTEAPDRATTTHANGREQLGL